MYNRYLQYYGNQREKSQAIPQNPQSMPPIPPNAPNLSAAGPPPVVHKAASHTEAHDSPLLSIPSLAGIKNTLQGLLGDKIDLSDLLLILILLLLYLEKEDEEILITLSALVFMGFK